MSRKIAHIVLTIFVATILVAHTTGTAAQNATGSLVGSVHDPTDAALSNATVTLTNQATADKRTVQSNDAGEYQFLNLLPGQYTLSITLEGFKTYTHPDVEVQVALATRENVNMQVGTATDEVTVTSTAPIIQSENASLGQVVQGKAVTDIPLNGRNVLALVGLTPGVVPQGSSSANLTGQGVFSAGNFQIGGGSANQSSTLFDGSPVNISYGNITILVPDQDVVQEFRAQTNNNTAEYGRYTGGVINITSKSGSNNIHGTVYEFVRNNIFNSTPYFSKHNPADVLPKNAFHQNQFGANIGFPILKDKLFGFVDYQGFRQSYQYLYNWVVPTLAERQGNFQQFNTPIYDPCGGTAVAGQGCPNYTGPPTQFPGNIIPAQRISPVARNVINALGSGYWASPTNNALPFNPNFITYSPIGGINNQITGRVDWNATSKQRIFGRWTQWFSDNIAGVPFNNGLNSGQPTSPEHFKTRQAVFGDTYIFSPSLLGDLRLSYLRWTYQRLPGTLGYNVQSLGFNPASQLGQIAQLNNIANSTTFPDFEVQGYNSASNGYIAGVNQNYAIAPSLSWTKGGHTLKIGADLRRLEMQYFQANSPGGVYEFDPSWTGNSFASFLLGYMVNQQVNPSSLQISQPTYNTIYYQGYYIQDDWTVTSKLTLNLGVRYDIPGVYRERHELLATFDPNATNPLVSLNGGPVPGAFNLVNTAQHPASGLRNEHFTDLSPRIGLAYRLDDKTVLRAGWGSFFIASDLQFPESSAQSPLAYVINTPVTTQNNGATPYATLDNPFPSGLTPAPLRGNSYQQLLLGGSENALSPNEENGVTYQWNVAVQRQLPGGVALEAAYAGLHGSHLPVSRSVNQTSQAVLNRALADPTCSPSITASCFLAGSTPNPFSNFATTFTQGVQQQPNIPRSQLYRPFPEYGGISNTGNYVGISNYNSLQLKAEKRFSQGGVLLVAYTFSKLLDNAESLTSWLEVAGAPGFQNNNNLDGEYSLSGYDSRQRLVTSYVYSLPFGRGQHFFSNVSGIADKFASGWGLNGVTTLQDGYPLGLSEYNNTVSQYTGAGTTRPNVVPGVDKKTHGPIQRRLGDQFSRTTYFNLAAFSAPGNFQFGNESRTDNALRLPGIANWDLALFKDTPLTEKVILQLRVESFNLFNRVQFGAPNSQLGNPQNGWITTTANDPRELQLAGRINF
jgi:Carboxypeptidase regulatory-like domain/TonB dependent receptor